MCSIDSGKGLKITCTWPPSRSVVAGAPPRYGTWSQAAPAEAALGVSRTRHFERAASLRRSCSCTIQIVGTGKGLAMLERERREDQVDRLVILPTARGHSGRGAGRNMKSPREVLIRPIALSLAAILVTTVLVAEAYSHATALHIRDPEDFALAFLLPTIFIAVFFGSTFAVASSFVSGLAAAYIIYPPQLSIWIHDPTHVGELGFIVLLAVTASKAVGVIIDGKPLGSSGARAASRRM